LTVQHYAHKRERYRILQKHAERQLEQLRDLELYALIIPDRSEPVIENAIDQVMQLSQQLRETLELLAEQAGQLYAIYSVPSKADAYEQAKQRFPKYPPYMMREYRELLSELQQELEIDTALEQLLRDDDDESGFTTQ
jgi:flagellar biosynthesis/type III secretory pathway protein FliH